MSRLFQKPINASFDSIEKYVDSYNGSNDLLLFKYLYLLSKKYAIDMRFNFTTNEKLNLFSVRCATEIFNMISDGHSNLKFKDIYYKIANEILDSIAVNDSYDDNYYDNSFKNYILSKIESINFNGYSDVSNFSEYISKFIKKIPKKKHSSEWYNIYKSVLLSFYKTIEYYDRDLFDYNVTIYPKVVLYHCNDTDESYISTIVLQLVYNLRDSFNKMISSKMDNVFTLHFKEVLNGDKC